MNSSVADIDDFIRAQKQKLNRDRNVTPSSQISNNNNNNQFMFQNFNDNYDSRLPPPVPPNFNNNNNGYSNGYYDQQQQQDFSQISPRAAMKQMHPSPSIYVPLNEQAPVQAHRITKTYKEEDNDKGSFFDKFGTYEKKKEKLKQDLQNDYAQFRNNKGNGNSNRRNPDQSSEYYATLPIKEHNSAKIKAENIRNQEYNYVKKKLNISDKANRVDWWKDHNSPDVKPYSKHASIENLNNAGRNRNNPIGDSRSQSQYDVIADRRLQLDNGAASRKQDENRPQFFDTLDQYRALSANDTEALRQKSSFNRQPPTFDNTRPLAQLTDNYRSPSFNNDLREGDRQRIEMMDRLDTKLNFGLRDTRDVYNSPSLSQLNNNPIDPFLNEILRRPPVGTSYSPISGQPAVRVQFNENVRYEEPPQLNFDQFRRNPEPSYNNSNNSNNGGTYNNFNQAPTSQNNRQNTTRVNHHESNVFNFDAPDNSKSKKTAKVREYQEELERQVNEKRLIKQKEKEEIDRLDRKFEKDNESFFPYGRGGGGAPIRDKDGNIKADLSKLKIDNNEISNAPLDVQREMKAQQMQYDRNAQQQNNNFNISNIFPPSSSGQDTSRSNKKDGEGGPNFARGGNGIFGEAKSDAQKKQGEKYKSELQRQIEEKKERDRLEKEKIRLEEEKEMKRFEETQKRLKLELEEEERKKREKFDKEPSKTETNLEIVQKRKPGGGAKGRKFEPKSKETTEDPIRISPPPTSQRPPADFRTNSPPIPALRKNKSEQKDRNIDNDPPPPQPLASKKTNPIKKSIDKKDNNPKTQVPDYFVTESRLNLESPNRLVPPLDVNDINEGGLVLDYPNSSYKSKRNKPNAQIQRTPSPKIFTNNLPPKQVDPTTARISKPSNYTARPPSMQSHASSSEVIQQLQNLKKHLHNEQQQLENELNNANAKYSVGQLVDTHQKLLSVRTPPGSSSGSKPKTNNFDKIYNAAMHNEPVRVKREPSDLIYGGKEPIYFRENSVLLQNQNLLNDDDLYLNDNRAQYNRINIPRNNPYPKDEYDLSLLSTRNDQRLRKLRDLEGDNQSLADPNDVLNKFMNRNNRRPSVNTLIDDTWMKS